MSLCRISPSALCVFIHVSCYSRVCRFTYVKCVFQYYTPYCQYPQLYVILLHVCLSVTYFLQLSVSILLLSYPYDASHLTSTNTEIKTKIHNHHKHIQRYVIDKQTPTTIQLLNRPGTLNQLNSNFIIFRHLPRSSSILSRLAIAIFRTEITSNFPWKHHTSVLAYAET